MKMEERNQEMKKEIRLNCEVTRDLLPLYHDGVASESTMDAVEVHLETCESCREAYQSMFEAIPEKEQTPPATGEQFASMMKKIKRRRIFVTAAVAAISCIVVAIGGYALMREPILPIDEEEVRVERVYPYDTEEGKKIFLWLSVPSYKGGWWSNLEAAGMVEGEDGVYQLEYKRKIPVLTEKMDGERGVEEIWTQEIENWEECKEIKLGDRVIWSREENGEEPVPDYVYAYEEREAGEGGVLFYSAKDDMIGIEHENGEKIIWDMDGKEIGEK